MNMKYSAGAAVRTFNRVLNGMLCSASIYIDSTTVTAANADEMVIKSP